jgi:hypothetical protein
MSGIERLPLSFRLLHPIRAGRIATASELDHEFQGLRAAHRLTGQWHRRIGRRVDHGMRLGYGVERLCRRALDIEARPHRVGTQVLTAAQARRQLDRMLWQWRQLDDVPDFLVRVAAAALCGAALMLVGSLIAVDATPLLGAVALLAPWVVVHQESYGRSRAGRRSADLCRIVLSANRERRRLLHRIDRRIAALGRLGSTVERECEWLQYLIDRCYLVPRQDIQLARTLAGDDAGRGHKVRALPDLTFVVLAISQLEIVTHEASACRAEVYGPRSETALFPFVPDVPEQRRNAVSHN